MSHQSKTKKKTYSRVQITAAGRQRLANKRARAGGVDAGITQDALNWAKMAEAGKAARAGMSNAERMEDTAKGIRGAKLLTDAEKKISYNEGLGVDMNKRAARNKTRSAAARKDAYLLRNRGKNADGTAGMGRNPADKTAPSNWASIKDFFNEGGDKKYGSVDTGSGIIPGGAYSVRRVELTSQERRLARLRAKGKKRPNATL